MYYPPEINYATAIGKGLGTAIAVTIFIVIANMKNRRNTIAPKKRNLEEQSIHQTHVTHLNIEQKRLEEVRRSKEPEEQRRIKKLKESIRSMGREEQKRLEEGKRQRRVKKLSFGKDMTPYEYEIFCSELLSNNDWDSTTTSKSNDQRIDIIARKDTRVLVVQCKLYSSPVGNKAVQEIYSGKGFENADEAIVVTNNSFTRSAKKLAGRLNIKLMHHDQLSSY